MQATRDNAQSRSGGHTGVIHGFWNWIRYLANCVSQATFIISRGERTERERERERERGKQGRREFRETSTCARGERGSVKKEMVNICSTPLGVCFWSFFNSFQSSSLFAALCPCTSL